MSALSITPPRLALLREIGAGHVSTANYHRQVITCQADCPHRRGRQVLVTGRVNELVLAGLATWGRRPAMVGDCARLTDAGRRALAALAEVTLR